MGTPFLWCSEVNMNREPWKIATHCCYCAFQCGMKAHVDPETRRVIAVEGNAAFPVNRGQMCVKGQTSQELLYHPDRLRYPLRRCGDRFQRVTWEEALDVTAERLAEIQHRHGRAAVGVYGGGALTNEKAYLLGKFARVALRTPNIDYNGRFCMSSAAAASIKTFGMDRGLIMPLSDIPRAKCILLCGTNLVETLPPLVTYLKEAKKKGCSFIVVDPRQSPTTRTADLHLAVRPGTDLALANALLCVLAEENLLDRKFLAERVTGFEEALAAAREYPPARAAEICGIPEKDIRRAARMFGKAATGMVLTARGAEQHSKGTDTACAYLNLLLATGKIGRPGCGGGPLTGQGNGQGGREHGQKADQLPGYRKIDDPEHRAYIASVWNVPESELPGPGKSAYELLDAVANKEIRGLLVVGSNPAVSSPNTRYTNAGLDGLDFLAVADFFFSETAARADIVFPATQWAEEDGTVTNLEGRVLLRRRAADAPGEARSDITLLVELAQRLGRGSYFPYCHPREIFEELRIATRGGIADYSGITWGRIEQEDGVFWPCPNSRHPGTPRLFTERFATPDGKARMQAVRYRPSAEEPDANFPFRLTTGRVLHHYLSGNQTRRLTALTKVKPHPYAEIHPDVARKYNLKDGDDARLTTRRGSRVFPVKIVKTIRPDTIFVPFHWGGAQCVNDLTNPALDPTSRMPEFKTCTVRIEATPNENARP
jgi:assimilatory nitrate reductase catalytic subunit